MSKMILDPVRPVLREWDGPLTEDLVQSPGNFGLGRIPSKLTPAAVTKSICGFCSTGCSLKVHLDAEGQAINLSPDPAYSVNLGMACPKGWEALSPLAAPDRATEPLLRQPDGSMREVSWIEAMKTFTEKFKSIQDQYGKASVAFLSTGQIVTEEMAFLGALAKFGMGAIHGDGNTRQCMATSVVAYKESFGFDAPPYTYADFEESDVIVLVGSNLCIAHPIMWQRVLRNNNNPEIVVIDPRKTETAMAGTQHVPIVPKSDLALFYGLAHAIYRRGAFSSKFINDHTQGFEDFKAFFQKYDRELVLKLTGLKSEVFDQLVDTIVEGKRVSFWWTMGVNQGHQATRTAQAIINLALMTGNIGRPGTGANSITGQCNAMGSRLFSNTTSLLGGFQFTDPEDRAYVAETIGMPSSVIPDQDSWAYDQIIDGIESGEIRGLWVIATNTAHSWMQQRRFRKLREKLDFLVVQDMYQSTDTAKLADLILPAAGWGEKEGTFINSERRLGVIRQVSRAPGSALSDFRIFQLIAHYWGCEDLFKEWSSPEAVFQILKRLSKNRPCDITGVEGYDFLQRANGVQWPYTQDDYERSTLSEGKLDIDGNRNERRLFADGEFFHTDGCARFIFEEPQEVPEPVDEIFPFFLLTGRGSSSQWHTLTRTGKSDVLKKLVQTEAYCEMNPADAKRLGLDSEDTVLVKSRRGKMKARLVITGTVASGQVFVPMHYTKTNHLTLSWVDPYSRQPAYKSCAVAVTKA
ncbi:MAG: molybdopterin-dependent oxidoreductase [Verrucomicrobiota bacterium]